MTSESFVVFINAGMKPIAVMVSSFICFCTPMPKLKRSEQPAKQQWKHGQEWEPKSKSSQQQQSNTHEKTRGSKSVERVGSLNRPHWKHLQWLVGGERDEWNKRYGKWKREARVKRIDVSQSQRWKRNYVCTYTIRAVHTIQVQASATETQKDWDWRDKYNT